MKIGQVIVIVIVTISTLMSSYSFKTSKWPKKLIFCLMRI